MKSLNTETIKYFIGDKFYFFKAAENFLYKDGNRTEEVDGIKVMIYGNENPGEFYVVKVAGTLEDVKGFAVHTPVVFDNLTGRFWAKRNGNFVTVELSMKADGITPYFKLNSGGNSHVA